MRISSTELTNSTNSSEIWQMALALLNLKKRHTHNVNLTVSSYSSYTKFLEKLC